MQGIAAELRSDRAFNEPCVESSPGSVGLFVESSIEASPIPGAQSSAESTIEVKPTKHTGQTVLATIGINGVLNAQPDAQFANHFLGPDVDNQPSIAVGLASDEESPGILSLESNREALHDDELIEPRPYTDDDSHIKSINKLINIAIECVDARKLYCQNESHFRQRLSQFLPGTFVDDIVLLQLLRMITEDSRLFVVDPLHLKLNQAFPYPVFKAFSMDVDGLVLPINVNASDQKSSTNTNHWVIAVVHLGTRKFNAFGMEEESIHYWASRIEALASEVSGGSLKLDRRSHDLGPYKDDSCCAFLCAFALDRYLEAKLKNDGQWPTGPELRERYFRRFLIHSGVPSGLLPDHTQQMDLDVVDTPESMKLLIEIAKEFQNIEPIQYNTLEDDEVDFFTRWLEVLHPELGT
ncbi:hypothetical protein K4K57_008858 [Colletotrichum sp. SAR 10_99]|nr:hypothetical protein K4K57_008858 [Colletotrichum sp. SAR 10_99]